MRTALDLFASHSTLFSDQVLMVLDMMGFAVRWVSIIFRFFYIKADMRGWIFSKEVICSFL